jgi:phospholipid transport system substrate-binding protein
MHSFLKAGFGAVLIIGCLALNMADTFGETPPDGVIKSFYDTLTSTMKQGKILGFSGRYSAMAPAVDMAFDLPTMARLSVGPQWSSLSPEQQKRLIDSFSRFSVTNYAAQFVDFAGERFNVGKTEPQGDGDVIVDSILVPSNGDAVSLNYRLRKNGDNWKIIDIYLNGTISQLASRRSEYTAVLSKDGLDALVSAIDAKSNALAGKP